jgi:putative flavoprotein involved in K+ transport
MTLPHHISTVVVGAGHAGLTMSRYLTLAGRDHLVLERRPTLGGSWQDRWDAFRLVTPNWTAALRGQPYDGVDPDGFMTRDEISERVAAYARRVAAPVLLKTGVERLAPKATGGFAVETSAGVVDADEVIVATGAYHGPRTPALASGLPSDVCVLHSHE